jgi:hypothetical protein
VNDESVAEVVTLPKKSEDVLANQKCADQPRKHTDPQVATLCSEEEVVVTAQNAARKSPPRSGLKRSINPAVKSWIDNVIVPALMEEWTRTSEARLAG